jgi:hypothetical protein
VGERQTDLSPVAGFSIAALFLSGVGLYSVLSYSVAQRTNEFGIRMALGATRRHVLRVAMASAGVSVGTGIAVGLALSLGLNHVVSAWVGIKTNHPLIVLSVSLLLLVVAGMACLVPARKAISIESHRCATVRMIRRATSLGTYVLWRMEMDRCHKLPETLCKLCESCVNPIASSSRAAVSYSCLTGAGFDSSRLGLGASSTPHGSRNLWFLRILGEVDSAVARQPGEIVIQQPLRRSNE